MAPAETLFDGETEEDGMTRLMLALAGAVVAAVAAVTVLMLTMGEEPPSSPASVSIAGADIGGPFELTSHHGQRVTSAELIDGPTLIYFGYTFCPDVCPVDAAVMADAVDLLSERGIEVMPVFITVDPARDDPQALVRFVEAMHPRMVGLTGSEADIRAAADAYKVYYARGEGTSGTDYLMNHSAFIYLVTPEGLAGVFRRGFPAEEIAGEVARILGETS